MENENLQLDRWDEMAVIADYQMICEIKRLIDCGDIENAKIGIHKLHHYATIDEKFEVSRYLTELMILIIKGITNSKYRIGRWANRIEQLRDNIEYARKNVECSTDDFIKSIWDEVFAFSKKQAEIWVKKTSVNSLSWYEVFEKEYLCLWEERMLQEEKLKLAS